MVYRDRFLGLQSAGRPTRTIQRALKPPSKPPFISDIGGRIWYIGTDFRGSRARFGRPTRTIQRALKPPSKRPFISDIGGRIWYIGTEFRGSRARFGRPTGTTPRALKPPSKPPFISDIGSDMVYRDRVQGLQSAVHAAPTDGAVVGARSTRPLWASPKCFQNLAGVGGAGFGRSQNQTAG
jgi:hypothetical protein